MMLEKLKGLFKEDGSPEDSIPLVILKLEKALGRLDQINDSLRKEDNNLFERCIEARLKNDHIHAVMYANECAEMRKIVLLVVSSRYALERMVLRLQTVAKLGSILVTVSPVIDVLKETRSRLVGIMPTVANSLNEANQILNKCMANMGTSTIGDVKPVVYSVEASKVLEEANLVAEKMIREKFPEIPENLKTPGLGRVKLPG